MRRPYLLVLLVCAPLAAAPVPKDDAATQLRAVYGVWEDPEKDSAFAMKRGELRVSLPVAERYWGTPSKRTPLTAPRAVREVEGDFTVVVRVAFPVPKDVGAGNESCYLAG